MALLPPHWRQVGADFWHSHIPGYAVLGTVRRIEQDGRERRLWDARVMDDCRLDWPTCEARPRGLALTLAGAQSIVEAVLTHTGTIAAQPIDWSGERS